MPLPDYLPGRFALSRGRPSDYFALEHFHYLPQRPATYADVWVVRYAELSRLLRVAPPLAAGSPFPSDESMRRSDDNPPRAAGLHECGSSHFSDRDALDALWRYEARHLDGDPHVTRLAAVGVLSFPTLRSLPRERALGLAPSLPLEQRLALVNAHVRTISRVVVHPQFRGLGLASALVRKLIDVCPTRYVEASAVMAHVHPFFQQAGMRRIDGEPTKRSRYRDAAISPAYFLVDKQEGSPCER
jgi:GNAT superfamily N-acetyltransferase